MNAILKNPSKLLAQPIPNLWYIAFAKSGNAAPNELRIRSFPANTDAMYLGYASPR